MRTSLAFAATCLLTLLVLKVEAGTTQRTGVYQTYQALGTFQRDFSGDAMQRYDSRMPSSPMTRIPSVLGLSYWPFVAYPPAPSMTINNVVVQMPDTLAPEAALKTPARSQFWIAHCGSFVELDVDSTTNLMEEEGKSCAR